MIKLEHNESRNLPWPLQRRVDTGLAYGSGAFEHTASWRRRLVLGGKDQMSGKAEVRFSGCPGWWFRQTLFPEPDGYWDED